MLSSRVWLERFPRQLRLFVALLMLLSFVAPTWHVCSLGGHVMEMTGEHKSMAHSAVARQRTFLRSASGALVCYCPPTHRSEKFPVNSKVVLNGRMTHDASCLALLLSTMPALAVSPVESLSVSQISFQTWRPTHREFPVRELIRTFSQRGPPR